MCQLSLLKKNPKTINIAVGKLQALKHLKLLKMVFGIVLIQIDSDCKQIYMGGINQKYLHDGNVCFSVFACIIVSPLFFVQVGRH